jgi:chromosomal replication initiation ATPase DnaA
VSGYIQVAQPRTADEVRELARRRRMPPAPDLEKVQAERDRALKRVSELEARNKVLQANVRDLQTRLDHIYEGTNNVLTAEIKTLCDEVLKGFPGMTWDHVCGKTKLSSIIKARHVCRAVAHKHYPNLSFKALGKVFMCNHSSVIYSVNLCERNGWLEAYGSGLE